MRKKEKNIISRRLMNSYVLSIISISLVLLLVGVFGLIVINAKQVSDYFKENIVISVILKENVNETEGKAFNKELDTLKAIKTTSYISKEMGTLEMKKMLGEDFLNAFETNPVPISIELKLKSEYFNADSVSALKHEVSKSPLVEEVTYQESLIEMLNKNIEKIGFILLGFIVALLLISSLLINNTVRLNIYSKRFSIYTMRLVGATKGFIRAPFLWKSILQGLLAGLIASFILMGGLFLIKDEIKNVFNILSLEPLLIVLGGIILLGVLICLICTFFVVTRMVSLTNDELYY